jgi:hypothetical protein
MENEFRLLIDRQKNIQDVKNNYKEYTNVLIDMVNYGSWLIPRAYGSSKKDIEAVVVISVLFKQVVTMIDSAEIQIANGVVLPAILQGRAAFEASLYIDWILKSDSEEKASYYYVNNLLDHRKWALRIIKGTPQQKQFENDIKSRFSLVDFDKEQESAGKQLEQINNILKQPELKSIYEQFNMIYEKGKREPNWYTPILRGGSLKTIARDVGRLPEYLFYYDKSSKIMHSSSYDDHVKFNKKDGRIIFEPIRNLNSIDYVLRFNMQVAVHTYKSIIKKYRTGELSNYINKYKNDWRKYCLNIPQVNYILEESNQTLLK